jgi:hypothetical protein
MTLQDLKKVIYGAEGTAYYYFWFDLLHLCESS